MSITSTATPTSRSISSAMPGVCIVVQTLFIIVQQGNAGAGVAKFQTLAHILYHEARCYRTFMFAVASRAGASLMSKPSRFTLVASSL